MRKNIAIILAGGVGNRLGADRPKQFLEIAGKSILEHSVDAFEQNPNITAIAIVSNPDFMEEVQKIMDKRNWTKVEKLLPGGKERYDSSLAAIKAYSEEDANLIFHDAVRPLVSQRIINDVVTALETEEAVNVAVPAVDTIFEHSNGYITAIPDRNKLMRAQTPQAFRHTTIAAAYERAFQDPNFHATDDCGIVVKYLPEVNVRLVDGEERNLKLTYKEDLFLLENMMHRHRP